MFVSGHASIDVQGHLVGPGDIRAQTRHVLTTIETILELAGLGLDDVVKTTVMLTDWRHYAAYNEVYRAFFAAPYPARSTVSGSLAMPGALIEIDAIAVAGARDCGCSYKSVVLRAITGDPGLHQSSTPDG